MKKTNEREATDLSTVETGVNNMGLELTVIHHFSFCTALWSAARPPVGSLTILKPTFPAGPYNWPQLYLCLQKGGENPERSRRTEEQRQSLGDGLRPSTHQRYGCSRISSVRMWGTRVGYVWPVDSQRLKWPRSQGTCGLIVEIRLTATLCYHMHSIFICN